MRTAHICVYIFPILLSFITINADYISQLSSYRDYILRVQPNRDSQRNFQPAQSFQRTRIITSGLNLNPISPDCRAYRKTCDLNDVFRRADGLCNNRRHPFWGAPGWPFRRLLKPHYDNDMYTPRKRGRNGRELPSPRTVSVAVHTYDTPSTQTTHLSSMFTQFGQFLDHDIDLTPLKNSDSDLDCCEQDIQYPVRGFYMHKHTSEHKTRPLPGTCFPINIPQPDRHFKNTCMNFVRSKVFAPTYKCKSSYSEQGNVLTSFIDMSQVYGSTKEKQNTLRSFVRGKLVGGDSLPANTSTMCRATRTPGRVCFGAGDTRVNEQPVLSALHIVVHRYHNYLAESLAKENPNWDDNQLFETARKILGAIFQHIVYTEYLPIILGPDYMETYGLSETPQYKYEEETDPRIINEFATAAFRFGHSMVPGELHFGQSVERLENNFFNPSDLQDPHQDGVSNLISGTAKQLSQSFDKKFSSSVSDRLFQDGSRSLDLVSLNIQRGRDHGLPAYNDYRELCGLERLSAYSSTAKQYLTVYEDIEDIDLYSGALSEDHVDGGIVGNTFACIMARQFRDLKYGDRFWYENSIFSESQLKEIKSTSLASILCQSARINAIQPNVLKAISPTNQEVSCSAYRSFNTEPWRERRYRSFY